MSSPTLPIFTPRPEIVPKILDDLCDAELSLREIADKARTTVEALSLWMASEEIQSRIALIQSTIAQRTRLAATCFLPGVVRTVNRIIDEYNQEESSVPIKPGSLVGHEYRRRSRESARRACNLLLRLARFYYEPARSSPEGGGGRRRRPEGDLRTPCVPDLASERASRVSGSSPSLVDLLVQASVIAPALSALAGIPGDDKPPPPVNGDLAPIPGPRANDGAHDSPAVEVPVPALEPVPSDPRGFPTPPTTNGHLHPLNGTNEHWP